MNTTDIKEYWNKLQRKLKQRYPKLTDADLHYQEGKEQDMLRMAEYKLHKTKKEMREIIADL
ncbi:MAG: general stress protein CsbD [Bacteroidales bacterium]|jgi:uncharacterized protein YjbJ (UPF0337 family)